MHKHMIYEPLARRSQFIKLRMFEYCILTKQSGSGFTG